MYQIKSVSKQVELALRAYIVDNNLGAGDVLPSESALSELFAVSRMTLRKGLKRLAMDGILTSRPGIGHMVLSSTPLRKYALLFGVDPLTPQCPSFHRKLAYFLRKQFGHEGIEPAFLLIDREDRAEAKVAEIRRRLRSGEFGGVVLVRWSSSIATLEEEILAESIPFLSISTQGINPNRLVLSQAAFIEAAYLWLKEREMLPATAIVSSPFREEGSLKETPGLNIVRYQSLSDVYESTKAALTASPTPRAIIVADDVAQIHAQAAILANPPKKLPLLAHMAIKGDSYPAGISRLLLQVDPQAVAAFCNQWLHGFPDKAEHGTMPIKITVVHTPDK